MFIGGLRAMLYVKDVGQSVEFYQKGLGFMLEGTFGPDYAIVNPSGEGVGLHAADGQIPSGGAILYSQVTDVDRYYAKVTKAGVEAKPPTDQQWGERIFYVSDPDGHEWGFYAPLKRTAKPAKSANKSAKKPAKKKSAKRPAKKKSAKKAVKKAAGKSTAKSGRKTGRAGKK